MGDGVLHSCVKLLAVRFNRPTAKLPGLDVREEGLDVGLKIARHHDVLSTVKTAAAVRRA